MNTTGIICIVICIAIFVGTIEQARAVLRQKTWPPKPNPVEAKRNTLRGDLNALNLGINQVQGYIGFLRNNDKTSKIQATVQACDTAEQLLTKARESHRKAGETLANADNETGIKFCELRLDTARLFVRQARSLVESLAFEAGINGFDDLDKDDGPHH